MDPSNGAILIATEPSFKCIIFTKEELLDHNKSSPSNVRVFSVTASNNDITTGTSRPNSSSHFLY